MSQDASSSSDASSSGRSGHQEAPRMQAARALPRDGVRINNRRLAQRLPDPDPDEDEDQPQGVPPWLAARGFLGDGVRIINGRIAQRLPDPDDDHVEHSVEKARLLRRCLDWVGWVTTMGVAEFPAGPYAFTSHRLINMVYTFGRAGASAIQDGRPVPDNAQDLQPPVSYFKGVEFDEHTQCWEARGWDGDQQVYLGAFDSDLHAAVCADLFSLHMRGIHADLNFDAAYYDREFADIGEMDTEALVSDLRNARAALAAAAPNPIALFPPPEDFPPDPPAPPAAAPAHDDDADDADAEVVRHTPPSSPESDPDASHMHADSWVSRGDSPRKPAKLARRTSTSATSNGRPALRAAAAAGAAAESRRPAPEQDPDMHDDAAGWTGHPHPQQQPPPQGYEGPEGGGQHPGPAPPFDLLSLLDHSPMRSGHARHPPSVAPAHHAPHLLYAPGSHPHRATYPPGHGGSYPPYPSCHQEPPLPPHPGLPPMTHPHYAPYPLQHPHAPSSYPHPPPPHPNWDIATSQSAAPYPHHPLPHHPSTTQPPAHHYTVQPALPLPLPTTRNPTSTNAHPALAASRTHPPAASHHPSGPRPMPDAMHAVPSILPTTFRSRPHGTRPHGYRARRPPTASNPPQLHRPQQHQQQAWHEREQQQRQHCRQPQQHHHHHHDQLEEGPGHPAQPQPQPWWQRQQALPQSGTLLDQHLQHLLQPHDPFASSPDVNPGSHPAGHSHEHRSSSSSMLASTPGADPGSHLRHPPQPPHGRGSPAPGVFPSSPADPAGCGPPPPV